MPEISLLLEETLHYPGLERSLQVTSPTLAIKIERVSYRAGYLPSSQSDLLTLAQVVEISGEKLISDTQQIRISEGLYLVTFSLNSPYSLRLEFPSWYEEIDVKVSEVLGLSFFLTESPGNGGGISQAELDLALSTKANQEDLIEGISLLNNAIALKANTADLGDFITTSELISGLLLKADSNHSHPTIYYSKSEVDALINGVSSSSPPQFEFAYLGDPNGLFYWLGSNQLAQAWANPHTSGAISVSSSSGMGDGSHANLVDRFAGGNTFLNPAPQPWVQVDLINRSFKPAGYSIRQRGFDQNAIKHWQFQGSMDGQNFTVLDEFRYQLTAGEALYRKVQAANAYRYFRVQMMSQSSGNDWYFCINEIELYGSLV